MSTITTPTVKRIPALVVGVAAMYYVYDFFLRVSPSAITQPLMAFFDINAQTLGLISAAFFTTYTPMQIPAGLLLDRYGPRACLTAAAAICAVATYIFAHTTHIEFAVASRFMIGFAASFAYIGPLMLAAHWLPDRYFSFATGMIQFMGCVGGMIGGWPVAKLAAIFHWQTAMLIAAGVGLLLAALFMLYVRDYPPGMEAPKVKHRGLSEQWERLKTVCGRPQAWVIALVGFAFWSPMSGFAEMWGNAYLETRLHMSSLNTTQYLQWVWWGVAVGGPFLGWLSNAIERRKAPIVGSLLLALVASMSLLYLPHAHPYLLCATLFCFGFAASCQAVTFGVVRDIMPMRVAGTAVGFNNMAVIMGGMLVQPLMGHILQQHWHGTVVHGAPVYSLHAFKDAFWVMPIITLVGLVAAVFFLKETHCQPIEPNHIVAKRRRGAKR